MILARIYQKYFKKYESIDYDYYVSVNALMKQELPRPKHKSRFIINPGEILPIITVESEV